MLYLLLDVLRAWLLDQGVYRYVMVLDQLEFRALAAATLAFATVVAAGRPVINWLLKQKIGDTGLTDAAALRSMAQSKANTPTMGGVLIVAAIVAATLLLADISNFYVQLALIVTVFLAGLGAVDDWLKLTASRRGTGSRQGLHAWEKFIFQVGLAALAGYFAYRQGDTELPRDLAHVVTLPFQKTYDDAAVAEGLIYLALPAFIVMSVLMIAGLSNAANISDGMDGLAPGVSVAIGGGLVALISIAGEQASAQHYLVPFVVNSGELLVVASAMIGACLGFLWWNCSPAQVFMGDTGSLALGGLIGYLALVIRQEVLVLIMCGVFLAEIGSVMLQVGYFRWTGGKRIFKCAPYHHHLHMSGWTEQKVVVRFWIVSGLLVVAAMTLLKMR